MLSKILKPEKLGCTIGQPIGKNSDILISQSRVTFVTF